MHIGRLQKEDYYLNKIFCKIQKLHNSFTYFASKCCQGQGHMNLTGVFSYFCDIWTTSRSISINSITLKGGRMKATSVPLHKILGSHALSQNSYVLGHGLQKI